MKLGTYVIGFAALNWTMWWAANGLSALTFVVAVTSADIVMMVLTPAIKKEVETRRRLRRLGR